MQQLQQSDLYGQAVGLYGQAVEKLSPYWEKALTAMEPVKVSGDTCKLYQSPLSHAAAGGCGILLSPCC